MKWYCWIVMLHRDYYFILYSFVKITTKSIISFELAWQCIPNRTFMEFLHSVYARLLCKAHVKPFRIYVRIYFNIILLLFPQQVTTYSKSIKETLEKRYCLKLTLNTPEWRYWRRSFVFIIHFAHIWHLF